MIGKVRSWVLRNPKKNDDITWEDYLFVIDVIKKEMQDPLVVTILGRALWEISWTWII